jgi:hypothetical protein
VKRQPVYLRLSERNFALVDGLLRRPFTLDKRIKFTREMSHLLRVTDYIAINNAVASGRRIVVIVE